MTYEDLSNGIINFFNDYVVHYPYKRAKANF